MKTMLLLSALALSAALPVRADDEKPYGSDRRMDSDHKMDKSGKHPDSWITTKVKSALLYHSSVSGLKTEVETRDGVVTLRGEAENQAQRELASEYANGIEGVKRVDNQMTIKGERSGGTFDDASITAQVKAALMSRRSTSAFQTGVKTRNGVVTLSGTAGNEAEKELAERLARGVSGVKDVDNAMKVE
ncbi:MAG: BON domain-containing protein [Elusimicrobia bacterium]|nr:BON domain-containing protein [Elusimicrobiota bacterium]